MYNSMNNQSPEYLEAELKRYKLQLEALNNSKDYENHPEQRNQLSSFYIEKIVALEKIIKPDGINTIEVIDVEIVSPNSNTSSTKK